MSAPRPFEQDLLAPVEDGVAHALSAMRRRGMVARFELLEAVSSLLGGFSLKAYRRVVPNAYSCSTEGLRAQAGPIVDLIRATPIPSALALATLAQGGYERTSRRRAGAYFTDFRLAQYLADLVRLPRGRDWTVVDPSCGSGALLAAVAIRVQREQGTAVDELIARGIHGADRSPFALRGALLSLASLTSDLRAIASLRRRLVRCDALLDSLEAWRGCGEEAFDVVVGNPPWEKIKASRHEFLLSHGVDRHYGKQYGSLSRSDYEANRSGTRQYAALLRNKYGLQDGGEPDLYRMFVELSMRLARRGGSLALLLPGGLIRSQSTTPLRHVLLEHAEQVQFTVFHNRARFFEIDTRFKFLAVHAAGWRTPRAGDRTRDGVSVVHAQGLPGGVVPGPVVHLSLSRLRHIRPDLSVPEVRSKAEWRVFARMHRGADRLGDPSAQWRARIVRELDMTTDRWRFRRDRSRAALPLVEGRMVHQFRLGVKAYRGGTGRRAIWTPVPPGNGPLRPQYWVRRDDIPAQIQDRVNSARIGFCDITGQTNERSMLAAVIPPGVVCGNKVPTVTFAGDTTGERGLAWLAVVNSLPFDWALRRVVTTTVNFFVLEGLPLPPLSTIGERLGLLASLSQQLSDANRKCRTSATAMALATLRARADWEVAKAYGLACADLEVLLQDFPLLDRGQPPIRGEKRSTVTRDFLFALAWQEEGRPSVELETRVAEAIALGARPYVPSDLFSPSSGAEESQLEGA